jgi:hypothetical protein
LGHDALNNCILLDNYYLPGDLERQIDAFVEHYNHVLGLPQIKSGHIGCAIRRELNDKECAQRGRRRAIPAHRQQHMTKMPLADKP